MKITVRFAGYYRSLAESATLDLELPAGATVEDALQQIDARLDGRLQRVFYPKQGHARQPNFLVLVNTQLAERTAHLRDGDVMAIVPPMAGGALWAT